MLVAGCALNFLGFERANPGATGRARLHGAEVVTPNSIRQVSEIDGSGRLRHRLSAEGLGPSGRHHRGSDRARRSAARSPTRSRSGCATRFSRRRSPGSACRWSRSSRSPNYACRSRNNVRGARLSEHAFGNALDVAGFKLANGRDRHRQDRLARLQPTSRASCARSVRRLPASASRPSSAPARPITAIISMSISPTTTGAARRATASRRRT